MQITPYLGTIIIWMKERFCESLVKIGFLLILTQLQSMPPRKSLQNWSHCPTQVLSYFSFVEHSLGFKTDSHDKNWIFYVNCKNNDGNFWKMAILKTSSEKAANFHFFQHFQRTKVATYFTSKLWWSEHPSVWNGICCIINDLTIRRSFTT